MGDERPIHEESLINAAPGTGALCRGNWKLVVNGQLRYKGNAPGPGFSWADLLRESGHDPKDAAREQVELFDLATDPGETTNRAAERPEVVRDLRTRYQRYASAAVPLLDGTVVGDGKAPAVWGDFTETLKGSSGK